MIRFIVLLCVMSICSALPYDGSRVDMSPQNVITVPPNCPDGQEWINGACRDIWFNLVTSAPQLQVTQNIINAQNMITVPPNCPPGQQWINGQCRDVWRGGVLADSDLFQKLLKNLWGKSEYAQNSRTATDISEDKYIIPAFKFDDDSSRNIISVPKQCPEGYKLDALGICRREL